MSDMIRFAGRCEIEAAADGVKPRWLQIVGYTGGQMSVEMFGNVIIDLAGLTLPASIPILADHSNLLASVIGSGTPVVDHGTLTIRATLAQGGAAKQVVALLESGVQLQASVGAQPTQRRFVKAGESINVNGRSIKAADGGFSLIEKSVLREVSITPIGADSATSVSLAASMKGSSMNETETAVQAERQRLLTIHKTSASISDLPPEMRARANAEFERALSGETDVQQFQSSLLGLLRASRPMIPMAIPGTASHVDDRHVVEASLMLRAGRESLAVSSYGPQAVEAARRLPDRSMIALGVLADRAGESSGMIRASSFSLPVALSNVTGKILVESYKETPQTWRAFAKVMSARNFKSQVAIRPSALGNLEELAGDAEIKHASLSESTYAWSIGQFAKMLTIDRKSLINDDSGFFDSLVPGMATAAARSLSDLVWTTIFANAGSFFHSSNSNLATSGSAFSAANLGAAISRMRKQRDSLGNDLDIMPSTLVVGPELEMTARAILESVEVMQSAGLPNGNALKGAVQLVVEPRVSNTTKYSSAVVTNWFLFASPASVPVMVGFLDGREFPTIETVDVGPDRLGTGLRCVFDYGCALGDFRAAQKATGAA